MTVAEPPSEFESLVEDLRAMLAPTSGADTSEVDIKPLMKRLEEYKSNEADWKRFAFLDESFGYTRNAVSTLGEKANLLILVWTPGRGSKIHDHTNAHCAVKMLQGTLKESLYRQIDRKMNLVGVKKFTTDQVTYISDDIGMHSMENIGSEPAISLHLYTPPYASKYGCHIYDEEGNSTLVSMSNFYSDHGKLLYNKLASTC